MMCCDYHNEGLSRTRRQTVRLVSDNQPSGTVDGGRAPFGIITLKSRRRALRSASRATITDTS